MRPTRHRWAGIVGDDETCECGAKRRVIATGPIPRLVYWNVDGDYTAAKLPLCTRGSRRPRAEQLGLFDQVAR